jgi:hypothetical protein
MNPSAEPEVNDRVVWTRGSVGLSGIVTGDLILRGAEPGWEHLLVIRTQRGTFHEFPRNLRVLPKMMPASALL